MLSDFKFFWDSINRYIKSGELKLQAAIKSFVFGETALGMAIPAFKFILGNANYAGDSGDTALGQVPKILIIGGVHGNETEGVVASFGLLKVLSSIPDNTQKLNLNHEITLIPAFNLDGVLAHSRLNGHGVDLNRNLPTRDWNPKAFDPKYPPGPSACSEPENQALVSFLDRERPHFILSLHSWHPLLNVNGACLREAEAISALTGYVIKEEIGYPTPGCLGTYAGLERAWPTLTYEIERGLAPAEILRVHVPAILAGLEKTEIKNED